MFGTLHKCLPALRAVGFLWDPRRIRRSGATCRGFSHLGLGQSDRKMLLAKNIRTYATTCAKDSTVALWPISTEWTRLATIDTEMICEAAQLSPDGRYIVYAGHDRSLYIAFSTPSPVAVRLRRKAHALNS